MSMFRSEIVLGVVMAALGAMPLGAAPSHKAQKSQKSQKVQKVSDSLGETMYVGDSITHGVNSGSWRWAMHKILVDNGISYEPVGYMSGNFQNAGVGMDASYGGVPFQNLHSAQASARTWELAGRKAGGRFNNTNLSNWLGLSDKTTNGGQYSGSTHKPQTFFLLIGTNDLLSDSGPFPGKYDGLLGKNRKDGDMKTVLDAMFKCNPKAEVTILTVPCWTRHANNNDAAPHKAVEDYNKELAKWVKAYNSSHKKKVRLVDVNPGMLDVSSSIPFYGCESMFGKPGTDGLHPSAQGDLIMAGNVARAMGYAGRSAGLPRKDGKSLETVEGTSASWSTPPAGNGFCAEVSLTFGDGAKGGWDADSTLTFSVGDGSTTGTLQISESCISWEGVKLYSTDMSAKTEPLRVAFTPGNAGQGVPRGYYVWLGDMLIGEGLPASSGNSVNGVEISAPKKTPHKIQRVGMAPEAYAPDSTRYYNAGAAFTLKPAQAPAAVEAEGDIAAPGASSAPAQADGKELYANKGAHSGAVDATASSGQASSWCGAHSQGVQKGDVTLRLEKSFTGGGTVMGVVNADKVEGDVYLSLTAPGATYGSFTKGSPVSLIGAYKGSISGKLHVQINAGTFLHDVMGGVHTGPGSIGSVEIYINGGDFRGNVYGGGLAGSVGSTSITMTGGEVHGSIHGGNAGAGASAPESSRIVIKGGTVHGDITAGTELVIDGSAAQLLGKNLRARKLTLQNVHAGAGEHGIDRFSGTLSGEGARATLLLKDVKTDLGAATIRDFDCVYVSGGQTHLSSLGGAKKLIASVGARVTVDDASGVECIVIDGRGGTTVTLDAKQLAQGCKVDITKAEGKFTLISTTDVTTADLEHIRFRRGQKLYRAKAVKTDAQAESTNIEPGEEVK